MLRTLHASADLADTLLVSVAGDPPLAAWPAARAVTIDFSSGFHRGLWALQLDKAVGDGGVGRRGEPIILAAHGVACLAVAWWAQLSPRSYLKNVAGAVFHAPLALTMGRAAIARSLWPSPATRLPFPSVVAAGGSPLVEQTLMLADNWGSRFIAADAPDCPARSDVRGIRPGMEERLVALLRRFGGAERSASDRSPATPDGPFLHGVR